MSRLGTHLSPVVWSDVDSRGHNTQRREKSAYEEASSSTHDGLESPKKKQKVMASPSIYYPPGLSPSERMWRDRSEFLLQKGYQLRPRYQKSWSPMQRANSRHHHSGEDHIMQILPHVMDAIRRQDGLVVCLKMIRDSKKLKQIKLTEFFSSRRMLSDSRNHVVPLYSAFKDAFAPHIEYTVMPVLRRFDDPEFLTVGEVIDFVNQILEGLTFLHENNVAHHNLTAEYIMMDAKSIIPTGWHFFAPFCEPDGMTRISPLDRKNHLVRYYFVGFGRAYHIEPKQKPLVVDIGGNDTTAPELLTFQPYDPFKLDVYTLGNVIYNELCLKYHGLEFLAELVDYMRIPDFQRRPTSEHALQAWNEIRKNINEDAMEDQLLQLRDGMRSRHTYYSDSQPRSYKHDISSILNK